MTGIILYKRKGGIRLVSLISVTATATAKAKATATARATAPSSSISSNSTQQQPVWQGRSGRATF